MLIVGELVNATRKAVARAIEARDRATIVELARDQAAAGVDYIDVNAGIFGAREGEYLSWLVQCVQEAVDLPCCIDSPNPSAVEAALQVHQGPALVNSLSLEKKRCDGMLRVLAGTEHRVVALCMSDAGMPRTAEDRFSVSEKLMEILTAAGVPLESVYVDLLVQPVATDHTVGLEFLKAVERVMTAFPGVHTICGLSNVSYGLPRRRLLNRTFLIMAIARSLDAAIVNPLDRTTMSALLAARSLAGRDEFCMDYIQAFRDGQLVE